MSDSDIYTTVLSDLWAFYCNSLELRHSVCEQSMKECLLTFKDCIKNVHSISLRNWQGDWVNKLKC